MVRIGDRRMHKQQQMRDRTCGRRVLRFHLREAVSASAACASVALAASADAAAAPCINVRRLDFSGACLMAISLSQALPLSAMLRPSSASPPRYAGLPLAGSPRRSRAPQHPAIVMLHGEECRFNCRVRWRRCMTPSVECARVRPVARSVMTMQPVVHAVCRAALTLTASASSTTMARDELGAPPVFR